MLRASVLRTLLYLGLFLSSTLFINTVSAQHQLFLELGGFSKSYSANLGLQISDNHSSKSYLRVGAAIEQNRLVVPAGIMFLKGNRSHFLELSTGITFRSDGIRFWDRNRSDIILKVNTGIAYRYQPYRGSYFVTFGLYPFGRLDPSPRGLELNRVAFGYQPGFSIGMNLD
ncbi:MAG: hypothetical protein AAFR87_04220 [Bacteroidota bacterium]